MTNEPTERQVLAAALRVFGPRELEVAADKRTGHVKLAIVATVTADPVPPDEVDVAAARQAGVEAELGDELRFPIYYRDEHREIAKGHNTAFSPLLDYPLDAYSAMRQALGRAWH